MKFQPKHVRGADLFLELGDWRGPAGARSFTLDGCYLSKQFSKVQATSEYSPVRVSEKFSFLFFFSKNRQNYRITDPQSKP